MNISSKPLTILLDQVWQTVPAGPYQIIKQAQQQFYKVLLRHSLSYSIYVYMCVCVLYIYIYICASVYVLSMGVFTLTVLSN